MRDSMKKLVLLVAFLSAHLGATTFYVAKTGSDGNPGTSDLPLLTIQAGVNKANAGDLVMVMAGTYDEQLTFPRSGSEGSPIVVRGDTNSQGEPLAIIDPATPAGEWTAAPEVGDGVFKKVGLDAQVMLWNGDQIVRIHDGSMAGDSNYMWDKGFNYLNYDSSANWSPYGVTMRFWPDVQMIWGNLNGDTTYIRHVDREWNPDTCDLRAAVGIACVILLVGKDYITLDHLQIQGADTTISIRGGSDYNTVSNCILRNGCRRVMIGPNASHNIIKNNEMTIGSGDWAQYGEWGGVAGYARHQLAQYGLGKWVEGASSSRDNAVGFCASGVGNVIDSNYIHDGSIGIAMWSVPATTISNNRITRMSSVGIYADALIESVQVYNNDVDHCDITFRIAALGTAADTARSMFFYNNRSYNTRLYGDYLKFYQGGYDSSAFCNIWFYHNSYAGGSSIGAPNYFSRGFRFVNNIFSGHYCATGTTPGNDADAELFPAFDYSFCGGLYRGTRYQAWMFRDRHNQWATDTMTGSANHQVWPLGEEPDWVVPHTSSAYQAGLDLSHPFTLRGTTYGPLPGMTPGYFSGAKPNLGAVQDTGLMGTPQHDPGHGSVTQLPELAFAPNPATSRNVMVRCAIPTRKVGKLTLRDVLGRTVKSIALVTSGITQLDLRNFAPGIYIAALDAEGPTISRKLVITAH